ncbi:TetR-like C-terminal domain-containing protein [Streptomyces sp. HSG2]|uniref:TetR-like C-terminal domain-containing protein n=1 Tax=Streptomyces sp. HSG2 TaxID=2797167 RepID=UPI001F5B65F5|nr:TetR-like C-terminal domain-containing protein [Streptomyces sp. HSG2]
MGVVLLTRDPRRCRAPVHGAVGPGGGGGGRFAGLGVDGPRRSRHARGRDRRCPGASRPGGHPRRSPGIPLKRDTARAVTREPRGSTPPTRDRDPRGRGAPPGRGRTSGCRPPETALPDAGDIEVDLESVLRATVEEFGDPAFDRLLRGASVEVAPSDAGLAAEYRERLSRPMEEVKKERLRGARAEGRLLPDADLDLILDMLYAPIFRRWLHRSGPLDAAFADSLVDATLRAFGPPP